MEIISLLHFLQNFCRKIFPMLCSIKWPNFTDWFHVLLETLANTCTVIVCFPGCDINFGNNLGFLIKLFFHITKKVITNILSYIYLKDKKIIQHFKQKAFFIIFKGLLLKFDFQPSWWVSAQYVEYTFESYIICHEIWPNDKYSHGQYFAKFGGLGLTFNHLLTYQPTTNNQKPIMMMFWLFTLLNVCTEAI